MDTRKIKRYFVDELDSELVAVSLVDAPAIESNYQFFSKQQQKYVTLESEQQRLCIGAALVPDMDIYRYDSWSGEEYYINFSKKCVENLADKFMKNNLGHAWTLDHETPTDGIYVFESWIKSDMTHDKSIALGLDPNLPVGTWFLSARINDNEVWEKVKRGEWHGFSVEALISLNELKFSKSNNDMNEINESFWERLKNVFTEVLHSDRQDEVAEQPSETEEVALEEEVKEETPEQAVEEPVEANLEEEPADETAEEEVETVSGEELEAKANLEEEAVQDNSQIDELSAKIADLEAKIAGLIEKNAELQKANEKLAAQPSAKPINAKSEKNTGDVMDIIRSLHDGTFNQK